MTENNKQKTENSKQKTLTPATEKTFYNTIERPSVEEFKDRGSKFIAYAYPVETAEAFKKLLQNLKKEHAKAVHHCFAYRIGTDGNNFRLSDDGEPAGTAGRPVLGQIDSKEITNTAIIVVRYFGGTLLGVPGLINAYKTAATLALQVVPIIQKQVEATYTIQFACTQMNDVMQVMKQYNCTITGSEIQLFCNITAGIAKSRLQEVLYRLKELHQVDVKKTA
jgi:uncharacterized YigZ family protein